MKTVNFIRMEDGTREEYEFLDRMEDEYKAGLPERIMDSLRKLEHSLSGYKINRLQHSLQGATRIAILAGNGTDLSGAGAALQEFAERYRIPVATTLRAKGVLPEDDPMSLGVFGYAGSQHSTEALLSGEPAQPAPAEPAPQPPEPEPTEVAADSAAGAAAELRPGWTAAAELRCDLPNHLYCFEQ